MKDYPAHWTPGRGFRTPYWVPQMTPLGPSWDPSWEPSWDPSWDTLLGGYPCAYVLYLPSTTSKGIW